MTKIKTLVHNTEEEKIAAIRDLKKCLINLADLRRFRNTINFNQSNCNKQISLLFQRPHTELARCAIQIARNYSYRIAVDFFR